jgi:hypothetical protein
MPVSVCADEMVGVARLLVEELRELNHDRK